jgi:hypothetical protein
MSTYIAVTVSDRDIKEIAADNGIPELEWTFALQRVALHSSDIEKELEARAMAMVQDVVLFGRVRA